MWWCLFEDIGLCTPLTDFDSLPPQSLGAPQIWPEYQMSPPLIHFTKGSWTNRNVSIVTKCKSCHFHVVNFTYFAASWTQPQFQGPLPPRFSSGEIPLQWVLEVVNNTMREKSTWERAFERDCKMNKRRTFRCADHILSCPVGWSCQSSSCILLHLSYLWPPLWPWSQSLRHRQAWGAIRLKSIVLWVVVLGICQWSSFIWKNK